MSLSQLSSFLPDTIPSVESQDYNLNTPPDYEISWGRLLPQQLMETKTELLLLNDKFSAGRLPTCDLILSVAEVGGLYHPQCSKTHFTIEKKELNEERPYALLTDVSSNGTYINGNLVGYGEKYVLSNNDNIAIVKPYNNILTFRDSVDNSDLPEQIVREYAIFHSLGKGGFGEVKCVIKRSTEEKLALKMFKDRFPLPIDAMNEGKILRALHHPNIVRMYDMLKIEDTIYLFLEYVSGGNLATYVTEKVRLSENHSHYIFRQILRGLRYLHDKKIIHRDVKPLNILLEVDSRTEWPQSQPCVKVTDFGFAKMMKTDETTNHTQCGTKQFAAPEILFPEQSDVIDTRVDSWSAGVVLFYCLSGALPFTASRKDMPLDQQIRHLKYQFYPENIWSEISNEAKDVIRHCLRKFNHRYNVYKLMELPWFRYPRKRISKENICTTAVKQIRLD